MWLKIGSQGVPFGLGIFKKKPLTFERGYREELGEEVAFTRQCDITTY